MKQKLQANIQGFLGKPVSLFGVYDTETGVLIIVTQASKKQDPKEGCIFITNQIKTEHDFFIDESSLLEAIACYYRLKNGVAKDHQTPLLGFGPKAGSADPVSSIELDGVSNSGREYRIAPDITNAQIASLAMCLYVDKGNTIEESLEMLSTLDEIMEGNWVTI